MVEDMAVPDPCPGDARVEDHGVALARGDEDGVGGVGVVERLAILGDDDLFEPQEWENGQERGLL